MRVALLLPGQIREAKETFSYLKGRIIDRFNADVFIASWNPSEEIKSSHQIDTVGLEDSLTIDEVLNLFKPKRFITDAYESEGIQKIIDKAWSFEEHTPMNGEMSPVSVFLMWYKIHQSFSMLSQYEDMIGQKYDYVIKGRFDIKLHNELNLDKNIDSICIPPGYDWRGGVNDIIAWGGRDSMSYYCSMYEKISEYISSGVFFHPETLLRHHLKESSFNLDRPNLKVSLRGSKIWKTEVVGEKFDKKSCRYIEPRGNFWRT